MILKRIINVFYDYKWYCAYRKIDDPNASIIPRENEIRSYEIVKIPHGYWAADPFLACYRDEYALFFEYTNEKKDKAYIAAISLENNDSSVKPIYEFQGHSSYPCIFEHNGSLYMIPETSSENNIQLLKCVSFPFKWEKTSILKDNILAVDCTYFNYSDKDLLFIYILDKKYGSNGKLYIGEIDFNNKTIDKMKLLVDCEERTGRPGGNVFFENKKAYRVVQPCKKYYGEKLEFYQFLFSGNKYSEKICGEMTYRQVKLDQRIDINGIHTINRLGRYEVIDVRTNNKFSLFRPIVKILQRFGVLGYDSCDKKMKYINGSKPIHL